jgi:hypothetical protein
VKCSHPKAVEVEDFNRNISCFHTLEERIDSLLVVIRGEAGTQPKAMAPTGDFSRFSGKDRVFLQNLFWSWAMDDVPAMIS